MKIQGFLDHLLKSSSGSGSVLNADFGKGAISGGALGLLLGKNKTTRKLATYGGLAERCGAPRAVRAAGGACAANLVAVVVPCHRVVRADGAAGHYLYGTAAKQALLAHEAAHAG